MAKTEKSALTSAEEYDLLVVHSNWQRCWRCGRGRSDRPNFWHAPFFCQRHHIVRQPRRPDVRLVACLCSCCHGLEHGHRYAELPGARGLSLSHLLGLKKLRDPDNWDRKFLQLHSIRKLPRAVIPTAEDLSLD